MITLNGATTFLRPDLFYATKSVVESIDLKIFDSLTSCKVYSECADTCLPVFASLSTTNTRYNDKTSFINQTSSDATLTITLTNQNGFSASITDSTYGTLYPMNTLKDRYWGLILDWRTIALAEGFGKYNITITTSSAGAREFTESYCFRLMPFSCESANNTVRITSYKNGYIENGLDYRDLSVGDWSEQIRLYGSFKLDEHTTQIDNLLLNNRDLHQIQTQVIDNFNLNLTRLSSTTSMQFIKDDLLSNRMKIDDYNLNNVIDYKNKYVSLLNIEKPTQHEINGTLSYDIKLTEYNQSTLKRNF